MTPRCVSGVFFRTICVPTDRRKAIDMNGSSSGYYWGVSGVDLKWPQIAIKDKLRVSLSFCVRPLLAHGDQDLPAHRRRERPFPRAIHHAPRATASEAEEGHSTTAQEDPEATGIDRWPSLSLMHFPALHSSAWGGVPVLGPGPSVALLAPGIDRRSLPLSRGLLAAFGRKRLLAIRGHGAGGSPLADRP